LLDIFEINALGNHNILNASAVIALAHQLKISTAKIKNGILKYTGVQRRFEIKHKINDIIFVDDYAHHPSEIEATLKSTKKSYPNRRIIAMFQPHLYSRTQDFYREFAKALLVADEIFIAKIYPAREKPIDGITSQLIADIVEKSGHKKIRYIKDFTELENEIASIIRENDILISLGAGTINMSLEKIYEIYEQRIMQKK
ncbi:MAG: cyanophycin synthetase, partial [Candidatus Marinimicrobia bacterium]|nr:cyanophycin synthetase [Candidatus Neomarinimicrobiota bacterium]